MEASRKKHDICGSTVKGGIRRTVFVLISALKLDGPDSESIYISSLVTLSPLLDIFPLVCKHYWVSISTSEMRIAFWIGIVICSLFCLDFVPILVSECSLRLFVSPLTEYDFHLDFSWLLVRIRTSLWCSLRFWGVEL